MPGVAPSETFVYDLEQGITSSVPGLKYDVSPFLGLAIHSSSSTRCHFMPEDVVCEWACASLGAPRKVGDGLSLAPTSGLALETTKPGKPRLLSATSSMAPFLV